jgi:hypothetical protein
MQRISFKGVLIGAIVDIVATFIIVLPLIMYIVATSTPAGVAPGSVPGMSAEILRNSSLYFYLSWFLGSICSVLGGYVSASLAKHDEILNGALSSFLCLGSGIFTLISGDASAHSWQYVICLLLSPALAAFGGFLRLRRKLARLTAHTDE